MMMNNKEIINKIGNILTDLEEQYNYLSKNLEIINELEMELFMANATYLTDHIAILQRMNKNGEQAEIQPSSKEQTDNLVSSSITVAQSMELEKSEFLQGVNESLNTSSIYHSIGIIDTQSKEYHDIYPPKQHLVDKVEDNFEFKEKAVGTLYNRQLTREEKQVIDKKIERQDENHSKYNSSSELMDGTLTIPVSKLTINDMHQKHRTESHIINPSPVKDLKSLINLNDKLLFVKDLFKGYNLAYSEAIDLLNQFSSFEEADHFLQSTYSKNNNWADKQSSVDKLYTILRRKF